MIIQDAAFSQVSIYDRDTRLDKLAAPLADMGHEVRVRDLTSGLHGVRIMPGGTLDGGADPRREGVVIAVE